MHRYPRTKDYIASGLSIGYSVYSYIVDKPYIRICEGAYIMWYEALFEELEHNSDENRAYKMSAYMQNQFSFLGLPKPKLKKIIQPYLKNCRKSDFDCEFVKLCWNKEYREAQYIAIDYLSMYIKKFTDKDLPLFKYLIVNKSWWDTVDSLDSIVGSIVIKHKHLEKTMLEWSVSDNIWLKRVSIDFQQQYKEKTNTELLAQIICNNFGSKEFFINKAIGWSLRDYSKINPEWVNNFLYKYKDKLSGLSIKEASKYLKPLD